MCEYLTASHSPIICFLKKKFKQKIKSRIFSIIEVGCYISWVVQKIKDYKFLGP